MNYHKPAIWDFVYLFRNSYAVTTDAEQYKCCVANEPIYISSEPQTNTICHVIRAFLRVRKVAMLPAAGRRKGRELASHQSRPVQRLSVTAAPRRQKHRKPRFSKSSTATKKRNGCPMSWNSGSNIMNAFPVVSHHGSPNTVMTDRMRTCQQVRQGKVR
jgi:hypothetical protein